MKLKHPKEPYNYGGVAPMPWAKAKVAIVSIPYEGSTSYGGGTNRGPAAIVEASRHMELWDQELGKDISQLGFFTLDELESDVTGPGGMYNRINKLISDVLNDKKWPLILGGEHSITPGVIAAFKKKYKNLSVLQIDAHTDLRGDYQGSPHSHASAMRRVWDMGVPVTAVGIRSYCKEEAQYIKKSGIAENIFEAPECPIDKIVDSLTDQVFITIDVDGFDPSIIPGTGTPEPGGLNWYQVTSLLRAVSKSKTIVGADMVELAPIPGQPAGDFLVAKLGYKLIGYAFFGKKS